MSAAKNPSSASTFIALPPPQLFRKSPRRSISASVSGSFVVNVPMGMSRRSQQSLYDTTPRCPVALQMASTLKAGAAVAAVTDNVHTPAMTLKNQALLGLIGTVLMTALLVWNFVFNLLNLLRGLVPAVTLFSSSIYAFGCFSVMVFFFVFHRTQS